MGVVGMLCWLSAIGLFGMAAVAAWYGETEVAGRCALVGLVPALLGYAVHRARRAHQARGTMQDRFFDWLGKNAEAVRQGTAVFQDVRITPQTELVRFTTVVSLVLMTFKTPSRYYIRGVERTGWINAAHTTTTLLLGWWGFPWGLVYTPAALFRNLSGGERLTVEQVLAHAELGDGGKPDATPRA